LFAIVFATSCNSAEQSSTNEPEANTETELVRDPQSNLNEEGTSKLMGVVTDYYGLKDALVATDAAKADEAANRLISSTDSMKSYISNDSGQAIALRPYLDTISMSTRQIASVKDETTEQKRIHFEKVSDAMFGMLRAANMKNAGIYRQYCPMAFNDKGAYWLSDVTDIKNPYFGKKMLECGEVTDSL
jgi:Cu(I)/Ag(I) efflux system membrane fusion protein